jgi:hypothetical protein
MARLFGFIGNRPDLGAKALTADGQLFEERAVAGQALGWGLGYYQGGEVLLRRRPLDDRPVVSFGEVLRGVRTDALIAHVRRATVGALRTENLPLSSLALRAYRHHRRLRHAARAADRVAARVPTAERPGRHRQRAALSSLSLVLARHR